MVSCPDTDPPLNIRQPLERIDKMQAETRKIMQEIKLATPWTFLMARWRWRR